MTGREFPYVPILPEPGYKKSRRSNRRHNEVWPGEHLPYGHRGFAEQYSDDGRGHTVRNKQRQLRRPVSIVNYAVPLLIAYRQQYLLHLPNEDYPINPTPTIG